MIVRYGPEPSVYVYDRQNLAAGPYAGAVDGSRTVDPGSYIGLTPDGKYLVGWDDRDYNPNHSGSGVSWPIDHVNRTVGAINHFWSVCGDHGMFISPSDGKDYFVTTNCYNSPQIWAVDITNNIVGSDAFQQQAMPTNKKLLQFPNWALAGVHFTTVAKGPLRDWAFISTEDYHDDIVTGAVDANSNVIPWYPYRDEIIGLNIVTGEVRRIAHHNSERFLGNYFNTPRVTTSWNGEYVGWNSNYNLIGSTDVYETAFNTAPP